MLCFCWFIFWFYYMLSTETWAEIAKCLKAVLSHWWVHYIIRFVYSMYLRMHDFAFISKLQEFVVLHTWTKNCAIQYCCVLCWCGMTWWWNWKSWFFSSLSYVSKMYVFIHFVPNFRFEPVFGWICYAGNQFLLCVNEVHSTS